MKRIIILVLSIMVILSGCVADNPVLPDTTSKDSSLAEIAQSISTDTVDGPPLTELMAAVETAELNYARIDVNGSLYGGPESVHITRELMLNIGNAILSGESKRLEPS